MRRSAVSALLLLAGACGGQVISDGGVEVGETHDAATGSDSAVVSDSAVASDATTTADVSTSTDASSTADVAVEDAQLDAGVDAFDAYVPPPTYTVGGSLSGLTKGTIVLQNNAGDDVSLTADAPFTFATKAMSGAPYDVTIKQHPAQQICTVAGGSGTVAGADVSVMVSCVPKPVELYVLNPAGTAIEAFDPSAAYGDPPKRIVTSSVGEFAIGDDEMFVLSGPGAGISVFDPSGTDAPARRRIVDPKATGKVAAGGGEVFTSDGTEIRAWNASDDGVVAPKRILNLIAASQGGYFAVSDGEIYLTSPFSWGVARVYAQTAAGNDKPTRTVSVAATCAGHVVGPVPIAVSGDDLVVTCDDMHIGRTFGIFDKRTGAWKGRLSAPPTPGRCAHSSTLGTFCEAGGAADIFVYVGIVPAPGFTSFSRKMIGFAPALY